MIKARRADLSDFFLVAMGLALAGSFVAYALPSLIDIYQGTYRAMPLPDGTSIDFSTEVQGMVALARHAGDVEVTGWAYDRRFPDRRVKIEIFSGDHRIAVGVTDLEEEDVSREAGLKVATPRFDLHFATRLAPVDPADPIRVFAISQGGEGRELFKGGRPVRIVDETQPKPA